MTASENSNATLGGVVIGRNEGERLRACLRSLAQALEAVVYVDSGSTDNSLAIAEEMGVETVELDPAAGFTAARGRNEGARRLLERSPRVEYIQFVDGDCEVIDGWIAHAAEFLREHPEVAVVCGRRRERYPWRNWYHRMTDMEWDTPSGETKYCGGDALMRVSAFREVDGFRETLIAGEEPELCVRLRKAGWKVWRLDRDMTWHDVRMSSFRQWWKRTVRSGYAYAEGARLHGGRPERHCVKELRSIWFWGVLLPLAGFALAWPTLGVSLVVLVTMYVLLFARIARYRMKTHSDSWRDASLYALSCLFSKWPQAVGVFESIAHRLIGSEKSLIEYGDTASGAVQRHSVDYSARN